MQWARAWFIECEHIYISGTQCLNTAPFCAGAQALVLGHQVWTQPNNLADNFNDEDLVSRCTNILQVPSRSHVGGKGPTNWSGPKDTPSSSFGGLIQDEGEPMTQPAFTDHTHKSQPSWPSFGSKRPRVNNLYTNRSGMQGIEAMTQPTLTDHTHKNQPPRPSFGSKRPRVNNLYTNQSDIQGHEPLSQLMIHGHTHNKTSATFFWWEATQA